MTDPYVDYLIDPSFLGVNRFFVVSFDQTMSRKGCQTYFLLTAEIKTLQGCSNTGV